VIGRAAGALGFLLVIVEAQAGPRVHPLAASLCEVLAQSVDAEGRGPVMVASYRPGPNEAELPKALRHSAFTYDNALAAIALTACGQIGRARRIGDALLQAVRSDRTFHDGRVRNAYRAGPIGDGAPALPGWWDAEQKLWAEDAYQDGTATGNVAWAALALLTLDAAVPTGGYRAGAARLLSWIGTNTFDSRSPVGFTGGFDGFDPIQTRLTWKSTEHNLDVHAVAIWLYRLDGRPDDADLAAKARGFLDAVFVAKEGGFRLGTRPDGTLQALDQIALDTQLWPQIGVADAPAPWRRALDLAARTMALPGGYDFNGDRDGVWVEGTAQAALTLRAMGCPRQADQLLDGLQREVSPSGYLYASSIPRLTTGLAIGPASTENDFYYFRRPHLGATAWAVLAGTGWNPFNGNRLE
jgi:hypothetical protein